MNDNESKIIDTELKILYRNQEDFFFLIITAGLAQSVERLTAGQHVVGSIPGTGPIGSKKRYRLCPLSFISRASARELAWDDFHARWRFARSAIPEDKWGTTRSLPCKRPNYNV